MSLASLIYAPAELLAKSPFLVQDVLFNAILFRADEDLRALAVILDEPTDEIDGWISNVQLNFNTRFWHEAVGLYYDYDVRLNGPIRVNTASTFLSLFAGLLPRDRLSASSKSICSMRKSMHLLVQSVIGSPPQQRRSPPGSRRRYWRGPVWIIMNWFIMEGLGRYGYDDLADVIRKDTLGLIESAGFREYYDVRMAPVVDRSTSPGQQP